MKFISFVIAISVGQDMCQEKKRNQAVAYAAADDEAAIKKAYDFLKEWTCKNPAKDLPTEYIHF